MKKIQLMVLSIVITIFVLSCSTNDREMNPSQIKIHGDGLAYAVNENNPFSGKVISFYKSGQKDDEANYKDGKKEG